MSDELITTLAQGLQEDKEKHLISNEDYEIACNIFRCELLYSINFNRYLEE